MANGNIPIGELFNIEKGQLQSTKCIPGEFDFITAAEDWKTHDQYNHDCEALIFASAASGSLGRTHYVDGKFISSDLCFILTPKNGNNYPINLAFYHFVFNSLRSIIVTATKSGTSKESINQTNFKKYKLPYFDIEQQNFWIEKLKNTFAKNELLCSQFTNQKTLLKKLRQQILQDAIEGKLTKDWRKQNPNIEPASQLLDRIIIEKEKLIKEKKIKKQKPLPSVSEGDKSFELPESWVWCRLGELTNCYEAGKSFKCKNRRIVKNEWGIIKTSAITSSFFKENENKFYSTDVPNDLSKKIQTNDLIFCRASGSKGLAGKCVIVKTINKKLLLSDKTPRLIIAQNVNKEFIFLHNETRYSLNYYESLNTGKSTSMNNITKDELFSKPFPLPCLAEQKIIVAKVEKLLSICDQLEAQITINKTHAEQLIQAVLKEAFSQNSNKVEDA